MTEKDLTPADWVTGIKEGYYSKKVQIGNCTAIIHRPILDNEERLRREEAVRQALVQVGKELLHGCGD